jgi:signal transduction histidine kinase
VPDLLRDLRQWVCDHPTFTDTLVAAVLSAGALFQMGAGIPLGRGIDPPDLLSATIAVAGTAPIALRRRAPVTVLAVQVAVGIATMAGGLNYGITWGELLAFLMGIYTVAAYRGLAHSAAAGAAAIGLAVVDMFVSEQRVGLWDITVSTAFLTGTWFLGRTLRLRRAYLAELTARAERLERAREADARAVRAEERSRIARELHDVVAHHVSVMTVQAGAARRILDRDPDRAVEALSNIEKMGRTALGEMRRVVGMLRVGPDGDHGLPAAGDRSPQPGIHEVDELVQQLRETGLEVKMRVEGRPRMLSPGVDLAAYRLIQEALTNTLKHAGRDVRASVVIRYEGAQLAVRVEDDGRAGIASLARAQAGTRAEPEAGSGHGLVGMRERVALYGGELRVGPRAGGGFEVRARFPLEA